MNQQKSSLEKQLTETETKLRTAQAQAQSVSSSRAPPKQVATKSTETTNTTSSEKDLSKLVKRLQTENEILTKQKDKVESSLSTMKLVTTSVIVICMSITAYAYKDKLPFDL